MIRVDRLKERSLVDITILFYQYIKNNNGWTDQCQVPYSLTIIPYQHFVFAVFIFAVCHEIGKAKFVYTLPLLFMLRSC